MPNVLTRIGVAMGPWFHRKIVDPLHQILRRGAEPKQLSFSAALGISLGVFPICGVTVFLCAMAIAVLGSRCHAPTVMLANFIATPIELSLVVPFLRLGEVISGGPHFPLTSDALKKVLTGQASREILYSILNAMPNCREAISWRDWVLVCSRNHGKLQLWTVKLSSALLGYPSLFDEDYFPTLEKRLLPVLLGWLVAAPFILGVLHLLLLPCCKILVRKFSTAPSSPKKPLSAQIVRKLSSAPSSPNKALSSHTEVRLKVRDV
ncbi:hypothetical protein RHSIM_Rhsim12G0001800 [Rhododendron simsii]|uniref:DUF2062 domain-containing protein n=1 Tax=Rhododendron simsii TaxID=118357 RepID=A0A834G3Q5_RHOSS|nr:hypothetical protein RHSIM_Rhsim12G0001800 [Rhododendron simsii]